MGFADMIHTFAEKYPEFKKVAKEKFLQLPHAKMICKDFAKDRTILGVTLENIFEVVRADFLTMNLEDWNEKHEPRFSRLIKTSEFKDEHSTKVQEKLFEIVDKLPLEKVLKENSGFFRILGVSIESYSETRKEKK